MKWIIVALIACLNLGCLSTTGIKKSTENTLTQAPLPVLPRALMLREDELSAIKQWYFSGRISIRSGNDVWNGHINWQQGSQNFVIHFNAPLGQGALRIKSDAMGVELRLADGKYYQAEEADTLLQEYVGWDIPLNSLRYWVMGLHDPALLPQVSLNTSGLPKQLQQLDWNIHYKKYQQVRQYQLPRKLTLKNEKFNIKMLIDSWKYS